MRLFSGRPEAGDVEAVVEVRSEVVHPTDGEEDVEPELKYINVSGLSLVAWWRACACLENLEVAALEPAEDTRHYTFAFALAVL